MFSWLLFRFLLLQMSTLINSYDVQELDQVQLVAATDHYSSGCFLNTFHNKRNRIPRVAPAWATRAEHQSATAAPSTLSPPPRRRWSRPPEARAAREDGGGGAAFTSFLSWRARLSRESEEAAMEWAAAAPARPDPVAAGLDPPPAAAATALPTLAGGAG